MGNTNSGNNSQTFSSRWPTTGQDSTLKQIQITTDRPDGCYYTGEYLTGSVEIPVSYLQQNLHIKNTRKLIEFIRQQAIRNDFIIELVGDATYSSEVDAAADSDGHSTHQVNICRQRCFVALAQDLEELYMQNENQAETLFDHTTITRRAVSDAQESISTLPSTIKGRYQLPIPDGLPPSLINNRPPSVVYTLDLELSSSRHRYQIPIIINYKGCIPYPTTNIELKGIATSQHDICLQAILSKRFYRPGEKIPVRINYSNPQQRFVRSITVTLLQFYRIHHDQYRLQLDGKEWVFDTATMLPQQDWFGETLLQLPGQPLQASFSTHSVGTTQSIECELDYRIFIELNEKKGDNIHLTLPSIDVTYQT